MCTCSFLPKLFLVSPTPPTTFPSPFQVTELRGMVEHQRYLRLQHLLERSTIYSRFMLKQMEDQKDKEKKEEEKQQKKNANKSTKEKVGYCTWECWPFLFKSWWGCVLYNCGHNCSDIRMTFMQWCLFSCCKQSTASANVT